MPRRLVGICLKAMGPEPDERHQTVAEVTDGVAFAVALEAMREVLRKRRCTPDAIARCAAKCGVASVVRPYLEAMA